MMMTFKTILFMLSVFLLAITRNISETEIDFIGDIAYFATVTEGDREYIKLFGDGIEDGTGISWRTNGEFVESISLQAKDISIGDISSPALSIYADDVLLQRFFVKDTLWQEYTVNVNRNVTKISIMFYNDLWQPGVSDRNVAVDSISYVIQKQASNLDTLRGRELLVTWDANTEPDLDGYKLYWGRLTRSYEYYSTVRDTFIKVSQPIEIPRYYAVTAFDTAGNESGYSNEIGVVLLPPDTVKQDTTPPLIPKRLKITNIDSIIIYYKEK